MRLSLLSACSLLVSSTFGFANTSPFIYISTNHESNVEALTVDSHVKSASQIQAYISNQLSQYPTTHYIFISQPGITFEDLRKSESSLFSRIKGGATIEAVNQQPSVYLVPEVVGSLRDATKAWMKQLLTGPQKAAEWTMTIDASAGIIPPISDETFFQVTFPSLLRDTSKKTRIANYLEHEAFISSLLEKIGSNSFTLVYYTTPPSEAAAAQESTIEEKEKETMRDYEMDESPLLDVLHSDLKRDTAHVARKPKIIGNQTIIEGPLFEKYQFTSPGIFMGFVVGFILLSILYVGISALSSLQVTYAAFDKEQGQLAVKKQ